MEDLIQIFAQARRQPPSPSCEDNPFSSTASEGFTSNFGNKSRNHVPEQYLLLSLYSFHCLSCLLNHSFFYNSFLSTIVNHHRKVHSCWFLEVWTCVMDHTAQSDVSTQLGPSSSKSVALNGFHAGSDQEPSLEELEQELPVVYDGQIPLGDLLSRVVQAIYAELLELSET
jgi:hypothetical protein